MAAVPPSPHKRHLLVAMVGLRPQVVTETLYYFWQQANPSVPVRQIYLLTTQKGAEQVEQHLLGPDNQIQRLCGDYGLPPDEVTMERVIVLTDQQGRPLVDIISPDDNQIVADQIFDLVRHLTSDPEVILHASMAGGRKTMGLYLGWAMQFYGRPGDSLSHVLVPPAVEKRFDFFYPSPTDSRTIVELATIPLLRLRNQIPFLQRNQQATYSQLIQIAQREYDQLRPVQPIRIDRMSRSLRVGEVQIHLPALQFSLYLFLARRRSSGCQKPACPVCRDCALAKDDLEHMIGALGQILQEIGAVDPRYDLGSWRIDPYERFSQNRAKINHQIDRALPGLPHSGIYQLGNPSFSRRNHTYYAISCPPELIQVR